MTNRGRHLLPLLGLLLPLSPATAAIQFEWLGDAVTEQAPLGSDPKGFYRLGDEVVYSADTPETGAELFATHITSGATRLIADLAPDGASSNPVVLGKVGSRLIIAAEVGTLDGGTSAYPRLDEVVSLDPVTGQYEVLSQFGAYSDINPRRFERMGEFAGRVAFKDRIDGSLWASDGTAAGTQRLHPGAPAWHGFCVMNDRFLFLTPGSAGSQTLWVSNGLTLGTGILADLPITGTVQAASRGDGCYFLSGGGQQPWSVWLSNGTALGTGLNAQMPGDGAATLYVVQQTVGLVLIKATSLEPATLWRIGVGAPIWMGTLDWFSSATATSDRLVFTGSTTVGTRTAFVSDATAAGTVPVSYNGSSYIPWSTTRLLAGDGFVLVADGYRIDLATAQATNFASPANLFTAENTVPLDGALIGAGVSGYETEVWRSDGTTAGSRQLADVAKATLSGAAGIQSSVVSRSGVLLYASVNQGTAQGVAGWRSLWRSDGKPGGTRRLPLDPAASEDVTGVAAAGDSVYLAADVRIGALASRIYRTDPDFGTRTLLWQQSDRLFSLYASDEAVFFRCTPNASNTQATLCAIRNDATQTVPLLPDGAYFTFIGALGNKLLFLSSHGGLIASDGTSAGTVSLASISSGFGRASRRIGNTLYFGACGDSTPASCGLYASDGTAAGTRRITPLDAQIILMQPLHDGIGFVLDDAENSLWVSDGSSAGTQEIAQAQGWFIEMTSTGDHLHILRSVPGSNDSYLVSDGTAAGTVVKPLPAGVRRGAFAAPVAVGVDHVLFACQLDRPISNELCVADSNGDNAQVVADFYQGPRSSDPAFVGQAAGATYFAINDGRHGHELWRFTGDHIFADGLQ